MSLCHKLCLDPFDKSNDLSNSLMLFVIVELNQSLCVVYDWSRKHMMSCSELCQKVVEIPGKHCKCHSAAHLSVSNIAVPVMGVHLTDIYIRRLSATMHSASLTVSAH